MSSSSPLEGKTALVTGAGSGLGARFVHALTTAGASTICVDINEEAAGRVCQEVIAKGGVSRAMPCDVASRSSVEQMKELVGSQPIDILVNNAGIVTPARRVHEIAEEEWDRVLSVNLKGTFLCAKAVLPAMLAVGGGSIINISSILGLRGFFPGFAAVSANYFAGKAGIVGFTKQLAVEYALDGIRANVICPGFHEATALGMEWRALRGPEQAAAFDQAIKSRTPMGRRGRYSRTTAGGPPAEVTQAGDLPCRKGLRSTIGAKHFQDPC